MVTAAEVGGTAGVPVREWGEVGFKLDSSDFSDKIRLIKS